MLKAALLLLLAAFAAAAANGESQQSAYERARAALAAASNTPAGAGVATAGTATASACNDTAAAAFCAGQPANEDHFYADLTTGCRCFYRCTASGDFAFTCQNGTLFDEANQFCNFADQTWAEPYVGAASLSRLANLPSYVGIVCLSFMLPDATYPGGVTFQGTGLSFSSEPAVVKGAIALLKQRNPHTKVLVSVGGATYPNWSQLNATAVAAFVKAFGLDGVDVDFEGEAGCYKKADGHVACASDAPYVAAILALRARLPRPRYLVTTAAWSIGAYGEGAWADSQPQGANTGMLVNVLRGAGYYLDYVLVMSYDAGDKSTTGYDPQEALAAYCWHFGRCDRVLMGVEVPPEAWGGAVTSVLEAEALGQAVVSKGGGGMMLWATYKGGTPSPTQLAQAACRSLALGNCTAALPTGN